jgi:hypothetical protein
MVMEVNVDVAVKFCIVFELMVRLKGVVGL